MEERRCLYCGRRLHPALRKDAKYCDRTCKSNDHRYRKQNPEPPPDPNLLFCRTPPEYGPLANTIYAAAPPDAMGYILRKGNCPLGNGVFQFPVPHRRTKHADGTLRATETYALFPFEPPRVPWEGQYELLFVTPSRGLVASADPNFHSIHVTPAVPRAAFDTHALWRWVPPAVGSDVGSFTYLAQEIPARAPMRAIGYSLRFPVSEGPSVSEFPVRGRVIWRTNGNWSSLPFYDLNPYEPPAVPWAGIYVLVYHLDANTVYINPDPEARRIRIGHIHPYAEFCRASIATPRAGLAGHAPAVRGLLPGSPRPRIRRGRLPHR